MNNSLNEYLRFNFELNIELNHFLARFNVKMNNQNVSATPTWYRAPSGPPGVLKGPVLARNAPFGALGGPRGTKFGLDCPGLARLGWTHAHHTL